ncbi:ABC transporter permease [Micromonospora sp. WMMA1923]|uniref:ABC transporter permease n=1 Tax=Micromonospora sp. WMMA1923 TaxID=3404125 RepID=UPI003B967034
MGYDEPGRREPPSDGAGPWVAVDDQLPDEPGPDRVAVHLGWEAVLLVGAAVLAYLLWQAQPAALSGSGLRSLLIDLVALGLLTLAAELSLRTSAVNLAIGPVAVAAALHFAEQGERGVPAALGPATVAAVLGGLVLALAVVVLRVPGWAASLAGAAGVIGYIEQRTAPVLAQGEHDPRRNALYLFAGFAALAVLGGAFGAIRSVRRLVGRTRPGGDPAGRQGIAAAVVTGLSLVASTVLAVLAGVLLAADATAPLAPVNGLDLTVLAVGTAMLAGTSAYGRRGGIFGTLLAVSLVALFLAWVQARGWAVNRWAVGGTVLAVGLLVTRLVETYGRPRAADADGAESPTSGDGAISSGWSVPRTRPVNSWSPALPTEPVRRPVDPWTTPDWGSGPRRWETDDG